MIRLSRLLYLLLPIFTSAQRIDVDLFGGVSNYQGDLQPLFFTLKGASPGGAVILKYAINDHFYIRAGFSFGSISADDINNKPSNRPRNLRFRSGLQEFNAGLEYRIFSPENFRLTPYFFAGAGVFRYNPYTYYGPEGARVYLKPLSTEGQGLPEYPDRKPYHLTQICIPYGLGIKWQINCNLNVGVEFRHTKTFTDYLDDVSTSYVDQGILLKEKGQLAVDLAWRRDEFDGREYPSAGRGRGNPEQSDWYYFAGLTIGLKLNDCETGNFSLGGIFKGNGYGLFKKSNSWGGSWGNGLKKSARRKVGCPRF